MCIIKNMASNTTNGEAKEIRDNIYVQKNISSDSNANPNNTSGNMKSTGAIPKSKVNSANIPNGISTEVRIKLNNNVNDITAKAEVNGTVQYVNSYISSNADSQKENSSLKSYSKTFTNGFKNSAINQIHKGVLNLSKQFSLCSQVSNKDQHLTSSSNSSADSPSETNGIEYGPSTSHAFNNIHFSSAQKVNDSGSECSSDTGNDDLSCSDECCIYTYKGDVADLPRSFMNLDGQDNNDMQDQSRAGSRGSSPEMDFLEMDFDPGPSCDADSDASSVSTDIKTDENQPETENFQQLQPPIVEKCKTPKAETAKSELVTHESTKNNLSQENNAVSCKKDPESHNLLTQEQKPSKTDAQVNVNLLDEPWIPKICSKRTLGSIILRESKGHHSSSGDLFSPNENIMPSTSSLECRINTSSSLYHSTMEKQLVLHKQPTTDEEHTLSVEKTMIWTEQEAALKQITQIGTSACGATAVLNVLLALGHPLPTNEKLLDAVPTRVRASSSPLIQYLKSRSVAGSTHRDLIKGLTVLSNGQVYAKFFHMYPERYINLSLWLSYWIKKGAVPIATLNLQKGVKAGNPIPDAWHHQMIFGVGPHGIYLTNPLERVEEGILWHHLSSESVLLVRREDVTCRWNNKTDLRELMTIKDVKWHTLNVLGQVANVVREHQRMVRPHTVSRTHVSIPAAYSSGITLAINISNPACELLKHCPELPILNTLP